MENLGVVNRSWKKVEGIEYIDIMRGSILGNPFKMKNESEIERKRVIEDFRQYLWKKMNEDLPNKISLEIVRLIRMKDVNVRLVCCCKPLDCHGDIIVKCIKYYRSLNLYN